MQGNELKSSPATMEHKFTRRHLLLLATAALTCSMAVAETTKPLKITVYGGTGRIGQRIVDEALNRGHIVTAVVRDPTVAKTHRERLTYVKGDALDTAGVAKQIAAQDVVVIAINASSRPGVPRSDDTGRPPPGAAPDGAAPPPSAGPPAQGEHFYLRTAESFVNALRGLGAKAPRLIHVGGAASLMDKNGKLIADSMPPSMPRTDDIFTQTEALNYYRTVNDVKWTYVSPSLMINPGQRTGKFRVGGDTLLMDADGRSAISMEDFAVAILDEMEKAQFIRKRFTVGY